MKRLTFSLITVVLIAVVGIVKAEEVSNSNQICADVLLVFARGSSSNKENKYLDQPFGPDFPTVEPEAGTFFKKFQSLLDQNYPEVTYKAMSVHDIPNKYSIRGYPASGVFGIKTVNNALNADVGWWPWGDYQDSVRDGTNEIVGYVRDEIQRCPEQKIVLGGYSQGAQVIGESLFWFSAADRSQIAGVALFGDPKYTGAETSWEPWEDAKPYPWKRGTANEKSKGLAEAREPYVPDDMRHKTLSWCFDDDFVCTGDATLVSQLAKATFRQAGVGDGHIRYPQFGIPQAANEILQKMSPHLYALNKSRGGVDVEAGPEQAVLSEPSAQPVDVMFLVHTSGGMDDVLGQLQHNSDSVLGPFNGFFSNVRYGFADFSEASYSGTLTARYNFYQNPEALYVPTSPIHRSTLQTRMNRKLAYGKDSWGGEDRAEPLGIAVEKTSMQTNWRPDAIKHIVLITDRPAKDPYIFNICNSTVWNSLKTWDLPRDPITCSTDPSQTTYSTKYRPELCDKVFQVISQTECTLGLKNPGYTYEVTRSLGDSISVAQSQGVAVSIAVPHGYYPPRHPSDTTDVPKQLEFFAKATGGLFVEYDEFSRANYSDLMWQILNHEPKRLELAYKDALEVLGEDEVPETGRYIEAKTNVPTVFDLSSSGIVADSYEWDFNGDGTIDQVTSGPNTQQTYQEETGNSIMKVVAYSNQQEVARGEWPINVREYSGPTPDSSPPELPENIAAGLNAEGDIEVTWEVYDADVLLVVADPETGLPVSSTSIRAGKLTVPKTYYSSDSLLVLASSMLESERLLVQVQPYGPSGGTETCSATEANGTDADRDGIDDACDGKIALEGSPNSGENTATPNENLAAAQVSTAQPSTVRSSGDQEVTLETLQAQDSSVLGDTSTPVSPSPNSLKPTPATQQSNVWWWVLVLIVAAGVILTALKVQKRDGAQQPEHQ